jgi:hypothetical protein
VSESAVLPEELLEEIPSASISAVAADVPMPARKQKRFAASMRYNGLRYLVLSIALGLAWGLIRAALWEGAGSPEATFMLALAGGLLAAAAKTSIDILNWAEATRQATHVERMRAVQRVYQRARVVREHAVLDWRRVHTVLVDHLTGISQEIRLFHNHDETDRYAEGLVRKALSEEGWIRVDGVDAAKRFQTEIAALDYDGIATEADFLAEFNALMNTLRHELALAAVGISLD